MKKKLKKYLGEEKPKLLQIVWTDSWCPEYGWCDLIEVGSEEYLIHSVGILVDENGDTLTIASSQGINNPMKIINPLTIPKCCIKVCTKL